MSDNEALSQHVRQRRQIIDRLQLAAVRLNDAQIERTWAIVAAHEQGLSVRQIAAATRLSPTRVHQLLTSVAAQQIPRWLSQLRELAESASDSAALARQPDNERLTAQWLDAEVTACRVRKGHPC